MVRILNRPLAWLVSAALVSATLGVGPARAANSVEGRKVFERQCSSCHSAARNGPTILGPSLFGVVGRTAGTVKGFHYSKAMESAGFVWTDARLRGYLPSPKGGVPGTKMAFAGLKDPNQVNDLVAYLDTLK